MLKISLKSARVNADLSQKEVARELGISNKTLCSWEKGLSFPDAKQISSLCELYHVSYDNIKFLPDNSL